MEELLGFFVGLIFGFFLCALLSANKVDEEAYYAGLTNNNINNKDDEGDNNNE